jgi:hypothetical protein
MPGRALWLCLLAAACVPPKPAAQEVSVPPPEQRAEVAPTAFTLEVSAQHVRLDGDLVETFNAEAGDYPLLYKLRERLEQRRGSGVHGEYTLSIAPSVPGWKWKSAFRTAAFAGFASSRLAGAEGDFVLAALVPRAPGKEHVPEPRTSVVLMMYPDRLMVTSFSEGVRILPPTTTKLDELSSAIAGICPRGVVRCIDQALLYSVDELPFSEVAAALGALAPKANDARVVLAFVPPSEDLAKKYFDPSVKRLRVTPDMVSGRLAPEVIQKTMRDSYSKFRACYEDGLTRDPTLVGSVVVRFVIQRDGSVGSLELVRSEPGEGAGTTLADEKMLDCILAEYANLSFQPPEGGLVSVVYPIRFSPEE